MTLSDSCVLAADAGGTFLKAALVRGGKVLKESFFSLPVSSDGTAEEILSAYEELGRLAQYYARQLELIITEAAVCTPGPFDYRDGCSLMEHKYRAVYGVPLRPVFEKGLGKSLPITFLHDSTAFLLGACAQAAADRQKTTDAQAAADGRSDTGGCCGVTIGTGLGFACMLEGQVQENLMGGPAVSLYSRPYLDGTAEDYVSKRGILKSWLRLGGGSEIHTVKELADRAVEGDAKACQAFAETGAHLGNILIPVLDRYPFKALYLGGAISKSAKLFLPALSEKLQGYAVSVIVPGDPDTLPLLGAVAASKNCREVPY